MSEESISSKTAPAGLAGRVKRLLASAMVSIPRGPRLDAAALDKRQQPDGRTDFSDSFYWMGAGAPDAPMHLFLRLAFRAHTTETWLHLWTPETGALDLGSDEAAPSSTMAAAGLTATCETPGERWRLSYRGDVKAASGATHALELDARFVARSPLYDFERETPPVVVARALAGEPWSRGFFRELSAMHQVHYEQLGELSVTWRLDGAERTAVLRSVRDHSFGARRWGDLRGHCWLTGAMDDGSVFNVTLVDLPRLRNVLRGYRFDGARFVPVVDAPTLSSLFAHGRPPAQYPLWFITADGKRHEVEVSRVTNRCYRLGGAIDFHEGCAEFTSPTSRGRGISEFSFPA